MGSRTVVRDGPALDKLHNHVWTLIGCHAPIIKPSYTRMFQARENLPLDVKSRQLSYRLLPQQLDRDPLLEVAFSPFRLIHNAHSAPADPPGNPPGTDTGAWRDVFQQRL